MHLSSLQHTAVHLSLPPCNAVHRSAPELTAIHRSAPQCTAVECSELHGVALSITEHVTVRPQCLIIMPSGPQDSSPPLPTTPQSYPHRSPQQLILSLPHPTTPHPSHSPPSSLPCNFISLPTKHFREEACHLNLHSSDPSYLTLCYAPAKNVKYKEILYLDNFWLKDSGQVWATFADR